MGKAIGEGALVLTTSQQKLNAGLDKAKGKIGQFAESAKSKLSGMFGGGFKLAAGMAVFNGIKNAVGGVFSKYGELKDQIDATAKASRRLGVSTADMQGLQHAAALSGADTKILVNQLEKLKSKTDLPLMDELYRMADAYKNANSEQERALVLTEKFGNRGMKLANLFEGGSDALKNMVGEAERLGFALSDEEAAKIESANDAAERASKALDGLYQQIIIQLAPAFEFWSNVITKVWEKLRPVFDWLGRALDAYYTIVSAVFEELFLLVEELIVWIGDLAEEWGIMGDEFPTIQEVITSAFRAIGKAGAYAFDTVAAAVGVLSIGLGFLVKGFSKVVDVFADVVALAKELPDDLRPDWVDGMVQGVQRASQSIDRAGNGMMEWGKRQIDTFGDSAKRVDAWFDRLGKKTMKEAKKEAQELAELLNEPAKYNPIGAALKGSAEAYSIEARFKAENILNPQLDVQKKQLDEAKKQTQKQQAIIDTINAGRLILQVI